MTAARNIVKPFVLVGPRFVDEPMPVVETGDGCVLNIRVAEELFKGRGCAFVEHYTSQTPTPKEAWFLWVHCPDGTVDMRQLGAVDVLRAGEIAKWVFATTLFDMESQQRTDGMGI